MLPNILTIVVQNKGEKMEKEQIGSLVIRFN